jgi:DNA mismatch repair ATPase MutS
MRLPVVAVWSSVRIQDSLTSGVSLFMAELLRLRQIVDAARSEPTLYLLDEILHGTNTSERRIAARTVVRHLLATGALGIVSTHDLELLDPDLESRAQLIHLVDQIVNTPEGPEMRFDYRVKPGIAPSSNALRLLDLVGLGSDIATEAGPVLPGSGVTGTEHAASTQEPAI